MSGLLLRQLGPRFFSTMQLGPVVSEASKFSRPLGMEWARIPMLEARKFSNLASTAGNEEKKAEQPPTAAAGKTGGGGDEKAIVSYWGVAPPQFTKEDGSPWRWNCFRPWESYKPDLSIDVKKHHEPTNFMDKFAFWTVQALKYPTYMFFQRRHMCHAMLLETVAAVPGMVGGMLLHCKSLRRFEHSGGWIKALLEEAENERMHLMTFIEIAKPQWYERALVFAVQGVFFNAYFVAYLASPKLAHRIVGYLEEEAVNSLPPESTLKDVVTVIRADEAHHRDLNHFASDIQCQGHELREYAAPIGYH
ncbi:hypothetical protein Vadar_033551 [Vaccinium darrowii]|uniref:Uncharacterized protein n=1 Tax=Vaccinium darrowii TaxID=229202 RepID=A0ACB7XVM4_9ERIC|nr:hypothetical protein Vadar_033551 [Vaccinium darrowii]